MNATQRMALANHLKTTRKRAFANQYLYKLKTRLPKNAGTFAGQRIGVEYSLGLNKEPLSKREIQLLKLILKNLPHVIRKAEKEWRNYLDDRELEENIHNPHISLTHLSDPRGNPKSAWTFVIGSRDPDTRQPSDFACDLEFKKLRFIRICGGD